MGFIRRLFKGVAGLLPRLLFFGVVGLYGVFAILTYWDFFEPYFFPLRFLRGQAEQVSTRITLGPYPNFDELRRLKETYGIQMVISLLNLSLPQEKALFEKEKRNCELLGLEVTSMPMEYLSVESESNKKAVDRLIALVREKGNTKVYIHCYLGRHRVRFVKKGLHDAGLVAVRGSSLPAHPSGVPEKMVGAGGSW